ncbi:MAG: hypothetical protein JWM16_2508 [Verrucomicrobiales bacterium]|nr:hypothetical protein [Verrucomicrobiales bacterium]
MNTTVITISPNGTGTCLYTELIDLHAIGSLEVTRASNIEFNSADQAWEVRLASHPKTVAYSHPSRETCIDWERNHYNA